ncbi:MAG: N-acetylmuramoyl-L-alanine amidase, partial [Oscillospiraceae bacterium]|nr:N-acetylmuramoyl-L-alanine amidase [Oscillospiraceae bacterium]
DSKVLAQKIQDSVRLNLQPDNKREIKPAEKNIYILYNALNTAVLVECGFISNAEECEKLNSAEYQQQIAFEIFSAVSEHICRSWQEG